MTHDMVWGRRNSTARPRLQEPSTYVIIIKRSHNLKKPERRRATLENGQVEEEPP